MTRGRTYPTLAEPKRSFTAVACALAVLLSLSSTTAAQEIQFDTLSIRPVGPGVQYVYVEAPSMPWTINVLEIDLENPYLEIETAKANELLLGGNETTSSMARRHDAENHRVVGAVNGDFYLGGGRPVSTQVLDGEILQEPASGRPAIGFDLSDNPMMEIVTLSGRVFHADTSVAVSGVNESREVDELVLYNQYVGETSGTNESGSEIQVEPLEQWLVNDTTTVVVKAKESGQGSMPIPDGQAVLSGAGVHQALLDESVEIGDTLNLVLALEPGLQEVKEAVSGGPFIVRNGVSDVGPRGDSDDRHPRTAIGFSADSTKLYFVTVDGRQQASVGVTLPELAYFMTRIGVHTAMNLDGGGSTTMIVRNELANRPSGAERPISNAIMVVSSAPEGSLSRLFIHPDRVKIFMNDTKPFTFYGTDEYFRPVSLDTSQIEYSVDPEVGTIDENGLLTVASERDSGFVYVRYGDLADSARVIIKTIDRFEIGPTNILADTTRAITFTTRAWDQDGLLQEVPPTTFDWTTTDPSVGMIDSVGTFRGRGAGTTEVVATYGELEQRATITVDVRSGAALASGLETADDWTLSGDNVDMSETTLSTSTGQHVEGDASLQIDYSFTFDPSELQNVYLSTELPISGVPDSLFLDAKTNGLRHRIFYEVEDALGRSFEMYAAAYADSEDSFKTLPSSFDRASGDVASWVLYHPVTLQQIRIQLASGREAGETYSGTLYLDNLRITYPATGTAAEDDGELPAALELDGNYPNPFSRITTIGYRLPRTQKVRITIYDVLGREVRVLKSEVESAGTHTIEFEAEKLPSGTYFYRVETDETTRTGSMMVVR